MGSSYQNLTWPIMAKTANIPVKVIHLILLNLLHLRKVLPLR